MTKRRRITLKEELAAALLALGDIPYEDAKQMTADQMRSLYHFDHNIPHAEGGTAAYWNLRPRLIAEHRAKTATIDLPRIAKNKRIQAAQAEHVLRLAVKIAGVVAPNLASDVRSVANEVKRRRHHWGYGRGDKLKKKLSGKVVPR